MSTSAVRESALTERLRGHRPTSLFAVTPRPVVELGEGSMIPGPWMTAGHDDVLPGSIGVLLDVGLSTPLFVERFGDGFVPLTSSMTIDIAPSASWFDGPLVLHSSVLHLDRARGLVRGELVTASGAVAAVATLTGRFVPVDGLVSRRIEHSSPAPAADPQLTLAEIFGEPPTPTADGAELRMTPTGWMANPHRTMQGGMIVAFVDYLAVAALDGASAQWQLSSMRISYLRPLPIGQELRGRAVRIHQGREVGLVRASLELADGRLAVSADLGYLRTGTGTGTVGGDPA